MAFQLDPYRIGEIKTLEYDAIQILQKYKYPF